VLEIRGKRGGREQEIQDGVSEGPRDTLAYFLLFNSEKEGAGEKKVAAGKEVWNHRKTFTK